MITQKPFICFVLIITSLCSLKTEQPDFVQRGEAELSRLEDPLSFRGFFSLFCTSQHWPEFQQYHPEGCNTSWCGESYPLCMILHTEKSSGSAPDKHLYLISHLDSAESSKPCSHWH